MGIALETRRLDKVREVLERSGAEEVAHPQDVMLAVMLLIRLSLEPHVRSLAGWTGHCRAPRRSF